MWKKALMTLVLFAAVVGGTLLLPNSADARIFRRGYFGGFGYYGPRVGVYVGPGYYPGYYGGYYGGYYAPYYYRGW